MSFADFSALRRPLSLPSVSENAFPEKATGWSLQQRYDEAKRSKIQPPAPRRHKRKPEPTDRVIVPIQAPEDAPPSPYKDFTAK